MIKKSLIIIISLTAIFTFVFTSCDSADDDGGQGADFDATQYYTKTEVDALIAGAVTEAVTTVGDQATIDVPASEGPPQDITDVGFANKTAGWTVPGEANFGVFRIKGSEAQAAVTLSLVIIGASETAGEFTECSTVSNSTGDNITTVTVPTFSLPTLYAWTDDAFIGQVSCLYWIK